MTGLAEKLDAPLPKIKITCTSVDCQQDLHCFLQKKRTGNLPPYGPCRACGAEGVDWERAHRRDAADAAVLFVELRKELIRQHMWTKPFDDGAVRKAKRLDRNGLKEWARRRLAVSVGRPAGAWDGRQTPLEGNVIFYAQHATATCCRKCMLYWHGIDVDRPLSSDEEDYCLFLIERFLDERLPELPEHGA